MKYAAIFAGLFTLWPVMAFTGAQGFAPLLGLAGLAAIAFLRPQKGIAPYAFTLILFVLWAAVTEIWSPASKGIMSGSLANGDFAIRAASLRIILVTLAGLAAIAASLHIPAGKTPRAAKWVLSIFAVHALVIVVIMVFGEQILAAVYGTGEQSEAHSSGVQNILRNANSFAVILPILASFLWTTGGPRNLLAAAALWALSLCAFISFGTQAAFIGVCLAFLFIALIHLRQRDGFKWLFGGIAAYIALAPLLLGGGARLANRLALPMPGSFQSRLWSWEVVSSKIIEHPILGHGLEASKTWRETYRDYPDWLVQLEPFWASYPVIPGHPHNMPLQIWAETGMVGGCLAALTIWLLGWRLPAPADLPPFTRDAVAGMTGIVLCLFSFAYNAWNEAFWAMLVLAACALILLHRQQAGSGQK